MISNSETVLEREGKMVWKRIILTPKKNQEMIV